MPITFASIDDPYGLRQAGGTLAQAFMAKAMESRAEQSQIRSEERAVNRQLATEKRQKEARLLGGSALQDALKIVADPNATTIQKIGALQQAATISGDQKGVAPLIQQLIKQSTKQDESQASLDFLRTQGVDIPQNVTGKNAPPASFLGSFAKGLKPVFEPESDKIEAKRSADYADQIVKDYEAAEASENRLSQMEIAAESRQLPTPAFVKTMEFLGIPLGILGNPLAEGYEKNTNEYIKDVGKYFPGQIRNVEIEAYMKTIPTLMNSDDGKLLIIKNQKLVNQGKKASYDAYKQILKENGGKKPRNLDVEILERTRELRNQVSDQLKQNFIEAVDMTQFPTSKVQPGTPMNPSIAFRYVQRAKGDREKAEKLAREDGYDW